MVTASVIGLGKAGLPLAAVMADSGINVIGVDVDSKRVEDVNKGVKAHDYSRSKAFADLLKQSGYDVYVYDEMFTREEIEAMGYKWADKGDVIVDTFGKKGVDIHVV